MRHGPRVHAPPLALTGPRRCGQAPPVLAPGRHSIALVLGIVTSLLVGCQNLEGRTKYLTGSDAFEWESDIRFHVKDEDDMWGQVLLVEGTYSLFVKGFPPGTTIAVGTATATVDGEGDASVETRVVAMYGSLPTDSVGDPNATFDAASFTITPPGGSAIEVKAPPQSAYGVKDTLLEVASGPLLFTGETNAEGPVRNAIWFDGIERRLFGAPAPTLADLDAVVIVVRPDSDKTNVCTGYTDDNGNPQPDVTMVLKDTVVRIHERRTGRVFAETTFPPDQECPTWLTTEPGVAEVRDSYEPTEDMVAWLTAQLPASPS